MSEKCSNCRYFKPGAIAQFHVCRRYPPSPNGMSHLGGIARSDFPIVREDDWCGEWALKARK